MRGLDGLPDILRPDESAWEFFRRVRAAPARTGLSHFDGLVSLFLKQSWVALTVVKRVQAAPFAFFPGSVCDVAGVQGAGKTQVLWHAFP